MENEAIADEISKVSPSAENEQYPDQILAALKQPMQAARRREEAKWRMHTSNPDTNRYYA